ncbi:hypothetical protein [Kitasatospora sp. NPDC090091]|uniref:hypothetical protein n=1 Tax=Kitasatospora sp. NPDC090091 TaxID=3364081 RepID=UPI003830B7A4
MTADISALEALVAALARAGADVDRQARQVVSKGALNIKRDWAANAAASSGRHAPHYPRTIGYDLITTPAGSSAVIGPDKDRSREQATYGAILEFGSVHNPPHNDGGRALLAEEPRFIAAVEALGESLL